MQDIFCLKNIRIALYVVLFISISVLFMKWQAVNQSPEPVVARAMSNVNLPVTGSAISMAPDLITVDTPLLQVKINPVDGNIVYAVLKDYKQSLGSDQPFLLLNQDRNALYYIIESGLVTGDNSLPAHMTFISSATSYSLGDRRQLTVNLTWSNSQGLSLIKSYTFFPNVYTVNVAYTIHNSGKSTWNGRFYGELTRNIPATASSFLNSHTNYTGAAISYPGDHYQKIKFADMDESSLSQTVSSGWVAMLQHYFITAIIPAPDTAITQFSAVNQDLYSIGLANPTVSVNPGEIVTTGAGIYLGPAIASQLGVVAPYLSKTIDYGWLWFISGPIFAVMQWIHSYVSNWGVAIILITCLIKLIFYPLSAKSYLSMAKMRELQPKIKVLREEIGDDRQKLGAATMTLYRKEKVNPLGGCLPILVQIPVFIALYWVLMESVELRQAPFIFWIHDLSASDPFFILPILMGLAMFVQQRLNPAPPDPMQAKIMMFLPLIFTIMFLGFPSGLVLYWLVNQCLSVVQQWWVMSRYHKKMTKRHYH